MSTLHYQVTTAGMSGARDWQRTVILMLVAELERLAAEIEKLRSLEDKFGGTE